MSSSRAAEEGQSSSSSSASPTATMMMESPSQNHQRQGNHASKMAMYENITYRKQKGSLLLTSTRVMFKTTEVTSSSGEEGTNSEEKTIKWSWKSIKKIQVNKGKIMIKFWSSVYEGKSVTFALESVAELKNLRLDVKRRLRECRRRVAAAAAAKMAKAKAESAKAEQEGEDTVAAADTPTNPEAQKEVEKPTINKRASLTVDDIFNNKEGLMASAPSPPNTMDDSAMSDRWMDESAMTIGLDESAMTIGGMDESVTMYEASESAMLMMDESALIWAIPEEEDFPEEQRESGEEKKENESEEEGEGDDEKIDNMYAITEESNQELLEEEEDLEEHNGQNNTLEEIDNMEFQNNEEKQEEDDVPPLLEKMNNDDEVPDLESFHEDQSSNSADALAPEISNNNIEERAEEEEEEDVTPQKEAEQLEVEDDMPDLKSFEDIPEESSPVALAAEDTTATAYEEEATLEDGEVHLDSAVDPLVEETGSVGTTDGTIDNQVEQNEDLEQEIETTNKEALESANGSSFLLEGDAQMTSGEEKTDPVDAVVVDETPQEVEEDIAVRDEMAWEGGEVELDIDTTPVDTPEVELDIDATLVDAPAPALVAMEDIINDQDETNEDLEQEADITSEDEETADEVVVADPSKEEDEEVEEEEEDNTITLHHDMDATPPELSNAASEDENGAAQVEYRVEEEQDVDRFETKEEEQEVATVVTENTDDIADYSGHDTLLALSKSEEDTTGSLLSDDDMYDRFDVLVNAFRAADKEFGSSKNEGETSVHVCDVIGKLPPSGGSMKAQARSRRHTLCLDDRSLQFARQHIMLFDRRNLEPVSKLVEKFEETMIGGGNKQVIQQIETSFESLKQKSMKRATMKRRASNFIPKTRRASSFTPSTTNALSFLPLSNTATTNTGAPSYVPSFKGLPDIEKENIGVVGTQRRRASSFIPSTANKKGASSFVPSFQGISESENENVNGMSQRRRASFMPTNTGTGIFVQFD